MQIESRLYYDLLEIIGKQDDILEKQNELIAKLINENAEKENMINELMSEFKDVYNF